jgi:serine/threonine protein kinase
MEQLQCHLFDALRPLVTSATQFVELGKTAGKLITILEKMHELKFLVIDIKPDNFMVASSMGTGAVTDASLADALRLIDLGLVKALGGTNDGIKGLVGNALYVSLNVHEMNTPSRRDDVQSILFLIADMVLTVQAIDQEKAPSYGQGNRASHFPWSLGNSDEAVGAAKRANVLDKASKFFEQMPSEAAKIIFDCIAEAASYTYKQKPLYEQLRQALSTLKVARTSSRKTAARSTETAGAIMSPPTQKSRKRSRSSASSRDADSDTEEQQSKVARIGPLYDDDDDVAMEEATVSDEMANVAIAMADVDLTVKGFGLYCNDADVWIVLSQDKPKVVVGKHPSSKKASANGLFVLHDPALEPSHVTLSLVSISGAIFVKPHNQAATVYVENGKVPVSGTCAFVGQDVIFGDFIFKVHILPIQSSPAKKVTTKHHEATKTSPEKPRAHHELIKSPQKPSAQPRRRRAFL